MNSSPLRQGLFFSFRKTTSNKQPYRCLSCTLRLAQSHSPTQPSPSPSQDATPQSANTHFGFRTLPSSEKPSAVNSVFTSVATSYDTMNDLMSLGIHRLWKDYFVRSLNHGSTPNTNPDPNTQHRPQNILDVAGGTGDIALRLLSHMEKINADTSSTVTITDINPAMLDEGRKRLASSPYASSTTSASSPASSSVSDSSPRVKFLEADAQYLPTIPSNSLDLYTVAFGIRNFTNIPLALQTAHRVLKPGGVFACLEFTPRLQNPVLNGLYKRWSFGGIPLIGQLVAGDRDSYQYLVESIERFPEQRVFEGMIREAGFLTPGGVGEGEGVEGDEKGWIDLTGGVAAIHRGVKPVM